MIKNIIQEYNPYNEQEKSDKETMLLYIDTFDDVLTRENKIGHFTASAWIVNKARDKVLLIYHKIYNSWAWTGGHADGDDNFCSVALKEAKEETGLANLTLLNNNIFSIEILPVMPHVKNGNFVGGHLHLNVTYLFLANENDELKINERETNGVKWFSIKEINSAVREEDMKVVYKKLNDKL